MPNGTRIYKRKRNGGRAKKTVRRYKKQSQKTVSINSKAFKQAVRKEATQLDNKQKQTLINRVFWGGAFNMQLNRWTNLTHVDRPGIVARLHIVPKSDYNHPANIVQAADVLTFPSIDWAGNPILHQDDPGGNQAGAQRGMITTTSNGFRAKEFITVKGVHLYMHCQQSGFAAGNFPVDYTSIVLNWGLYTADVASLIAADPLYVPTINDLALRETRGYTPTLDIERQNLVKETSSRKLASGRYVMKLRFDQPMQPLVRDFEKYIKFKSPLKIEYTPTSQTGQEVVKNPLYLVMWTNQLAAEGNSRLRIGAISKMYYYDE